MAKMIRAIPWALHVQHTHASYRELSTLWSHGSHSNSGEIRTPARPEPNIFPSCQLKEFYSAIRNISPLLFFPSCTELWLCTVWNVFLSQSGWRRGEVGEGSVCPSTGATASHHLPRSACMRSPMHYALGLKYSGTPLKKSAPKLGTPP